MTERAPAYESGQIRTPEEEGGQRFSWNKVLAGVAVGSVALPLACLAVISFYNQTNLVITAFEMGYVFSLEMGAAGAVLGGIMGGIIQS